MSDISYSVVPNAHEMLEHQSTAQVVLHPLTLINITDHYTRRNFGAKPGESQKRVIGLLLGEQSDKKIEIFTSFEALFDDQDGKGTHGVLDLEFIKKQKDQFSKVYKTFDLVGWYITGSGLTAEDIAVTHQQVRENFCESPMIMVVDTNPPSSVHSLPVYVFESVIKVDKGDIKVTVMKTKYTVESEESERVGIDTAMQVDFLGEENPTLVPTAQRMQNAVSMLQMRIDIVLAYLQEVKAGAITPDYDLLRKVSSLCNQLPCAESPSFEHSFGREYEDALLIIYMSLVTKGAGFLSRLVEKSSVFAERRRVGGMGFFGAGM